MDSTTPEGEVEFTETPPLPPPPATKLSELETVTWKMHAERLEKLQLQQLLLQSQQQALLVEVQTSAARLDAHKERMRMFYGLGDADRINLDTGEILRAPPPAPTVAN